MFSNSEFRLAHCTAPFTVSACKQPSYRPLLRLEQLRGRSPPPTGWRRSHSEAWGLWRSCGTCHGNWDRETIRWVYRISRISICPTSFFTFSPNCLVIQFSKRNSLHPVAWLRMELFSIQKVWTHCIEVVWGSREKGISASSTVDFSLGDCWILVLCYLIVRKIHLISNDT